MLACGLVKTIQKCTQLIRLLYRIDAEKILETGRNFDGGFFFKFKTQVGQWNVSLTSYFPRNFVPF